MGTSSPSVLGASEAPRLSISDKTSVSSNQLTASGAWRARDIEAVRVEMLVRRCRRQSSRHTDSGIGELASNEAGAICCLVFV